MAFGTGCFGLQLAPSFVGKCLGVTMAFGADCLSLQLAPSFVGE